MSDDLRKFTHPELQARQAAQRSLPKLPFTLVLNNIRSLYNVGSIFRTADGAGVEKIWLCGITGIPPDPMISKTALGAEKTVPWEFRRNAADCLKGLKEQGYQIVLLEQTAKSISYDQFVPKNPLCLVVGNEIEGVSEVLLPFCDAAVEIEMMGLKNSLNVAVACGIVIYQWRQYLKQTV